MRTFVCSVCALLLYSCDLIDYHPYDGRVKGDQNLNNSAMKQITEICREKDTNILLLSLFVQFVIPPIHILK